MVILALRIPIHNGVSLYTHYGVEGALSVVEILAFSLWKLLRRPRVIRRLLGRTSRAIL